MCLGLGASSWRALAETSQEWACPWAWLGQEGLSILASFLVLGKEGMQVV